METQLEEKKQSSSTLDVQRIIYERHLKAIEKRDGLNRAQIIEQINNPDVYKKITKIRNR